MKIQHYKHDIYFTLDSIESAPKNLLINNKRYFRFHNFIFIPNELEVLNINQVIAVNEIRNRYFNLLHQNSVNNYVKSFFKKMITQSSAQRIVELGGGINPLFSSEFGRFNLTVVDINPNSVNILKDEGYNCYTLNENMEIPLDDGNTDLIFAIFVFQFRISPKLILDLYRILESDGVIVANVYRRTQTSKQFLAKLFKRAGFHVINYEDSTGCCRGHEYWCIFKKETSILFTEINHFLKNNK